MSYKRKNKTRKKGGSYIRRKMKTMKTSFKNKRQEKKEQKKLKEYVVEQFEKLGEYNTRTIVVKNTINIKNIETDKNDTISLRYQKSDDNKTLCFIVKIPNSNDPNSNDMFHLCYRLDKLPKCFDIMKRNMTDTIAPLNDHEKDISENFEEFMDYIKNKKNLVSVSVIKIPSHSSSRSSSGTSSRSSSSPFSFTPSSRSSSRSPSGTPIGSSHLVELEPNTKSVIGN